MSHHGALFYFVQSVKTSQTPKATSADLLRKDADISVLTPYPPIFRRLFMLRGVVKRHDRLFCTSAVRPQITVKCRGPRRQVRATSSAS